MDREQKTKLKIRKRIIIGVLIAIVIIVEIIAFRARRTKAQEVIDVDVTLNDYDSMLSQEVVTMQATLDNNGYFITLPETINNRIVLKYYADTPITSEAVGLFDITKDVTSLAGVTSDEMHTVELIYPETSEGTDEDTSSQEETNIAAPTTELTNLDTNTVVEDNADEENAIDTDNTNTTIIEPTTKPPADEGDENNNETDIIDNTNTITNTISNEVTNTLTNTVVENTIVDNTTNTINENVVTNEVEDATENIIKDFKTIELLPGDKYYLPQSDSDNRLTTITVKYDSKTVKDRELYNQVIYDRIGDNNVEITGFIPNNAEVSIITEVPDDVADSINEKLDENSILTSLFYIKVLVDGEEFNLEEYGEDLTITVDIDSIEKDYTVLEIEDENDRISSFYKQNVDKKEYMAPNIISDVPSYQLADVTDKNDGDISITESDVVLKPNAISFKANGSRAYAIVQTVAENGTVTDTIEDVIITGEKWDGTVATTFSGGNGTAASPYLILDGSELALLAQRVNSGTNYDGVYFQLVGDIDLNDRTWTPIGTNGNSFSGIFDGAGHSISNGVIETPTSATNGSSYSYGIFGSIMGVSTIAEIRNTEFNNIEININSLNNNVTMKVGIVTGSIYRKSKVSNVIVKSGDISTTRSYSIPGNTVSLLVGGIAGEASNTNTSNTDPGAGNRYSIENCFVSLTVDTDNCTPNANTTSSNYLVYAAQFSTGGIIGRIRSQNVWPINCMVTSNLAAAGFIGPIFGSVLNNTSYTDYTNLNTIWNGNDAAGGSNLTMDSYYNTYSANSTTFTSSYVSGSTPENTTYRRNAEVRTRRNGWGTNSYTYNPGYLQGVNKASRLTNMNTMLTNFNNYNASNLDNKIQFVYSNNQFSLKRRLSAGVTDNGDFTYTVTQTDPYNIGTYTYNWYINGELDTTRTDATEEVKNESFQDSIPVKVIVSDGDYFSVIKFAVPKLYVKLDFTVDYTNLSNIKIDAEIVGPGTLSSMYDIDDYTFAWYEIDIAGLNETLIEGANSLTLEHAEEGLEYKLVATNSEISQLSTEGKQIVGERNVVYLYYTTSNNTYGNDTRLGETPETAVRSLSRAYDLLPANTHRNKNIIVLMNNYQSNSIYNDDESTTYDKNATITGAYNGIRYSPRLYMYGSTSSYRYLCGDTTFQYLDWYGGNNQLYLYVQGYDLTMGEEISMISYPAANSNQGLITGSAPAVHIFGGWCQYNRQTLPANESNGTRTKAEILIKSGAYGRVLGGGSSGTSGSASIYMTTSHNFVGSNLTTDSYDIEITVDIKNSTKGTYAYDVNLLGGGATAGNTYGHATVNIHNGTIGRVLGGSIGDSSYVPNTSNSLTNSRWTWPINTYIGSATINMTNGTVTEVYGGSLGRNMKSIGTSAASNDRQSDSYFYGQITINISGGTVTQKIYGAGAGAVTGYSTNSTDPYKSYGQNIDSSVTINLSGGTIQSNVYGGGYGYTEYLSNNVITVDGGSLYGDSTINISGSPTVNGSIFAGGCGYNLSSKPRLAQVEGDTEININGTPTIQGSVFGAGAGITNLNDMAKLIGTSTVNINTDLTCAVYGGGNIARLEGTANLHINSGTHSGAMYGGGNVGLVDGNTYVEVKGTTNTGNIFGGGNQATVTTTVVDIKSGTNNNSIFGGGNEADVNKSTVNILGGTNTNVFACGNQATSSDPIVYIDAGTTTNVFGGGNNASVSATQVRLRGGTATTVYGGSNSSGTVTTTNVIATTGTATTIYGGNNAGGTVTTSNVTVNGGTITNVYGGNNAAGTTVTSNVDINNNVTNVYGGNNTAGTTTTSNVNINSGNVTAVYGGGNVASTGTTHVNIIGGKVIDAYGGGNQAGISTQTNVIVTGGETTNVYGGSNQSALNTVAKSVVNINCATLPSGQDYNVTNVYGGNNSSGITADPNVTITKGTIQNVFGGGNEAAVTKTTVRILNGTIDNVYGGGNAAEVNTNTDLVITGGTINDNIYGGGNEGSVLGTSNASVKDATVLGSAYGGGNGVSAIVVGNSMLTVQGNSIIGSQGCDTPNRGSVFGGGNAASTGTSETNANSILNVVGGTIYGNTYGGANTSIIYGKAKANIGMSAVSNNTNLTQGDIHIYGTSFGGGEANASGSDTFDWDTIIVTNGIDVIIDAEGYNEFLIDGSIFGSGNASATGGISTVNIRNYGTVDEPKYNISLQRTNRFILDNSAIAVDGATDRANEYASVYYSISRIDSLKLKNSSTLYLNYGANLLKEFTSAVDNEDTGLEELATITIDPDTGAVSNKNVDNRIYMYEGRNLNIATNENNTAYGNVNGMTFFGIFTSTANPATTNAFYNHRYNNGDTISNAGTFSLNSYVLGAHKREPEHDIEADGFYTNINNEGSIKCEYVDVTPPDDTYYMWIVGDAVDVTVYEITLTASKYATLGTIELPLTGFSTPNTKFILNGFTVGMKSGISLIDKNDIESIASTETLANTLFALNMKNGKSGWITDNSNNFFSANDGYYDGQVLYQTENLAITPSLTFCLYHSQNITLDQSIGNAKIRFQVLIPIDDLNYRPAYVDIIVTMISDLYPDDFYEAAITPGEEFELFTTTETNITSDSMFSMYYSLYIPDFSNNDLYDDYSTYNRCLVSRNADGTVFYLPANTTITMLDLVTKNTYYYNVSASDYSNHKYIFDLSDFTRMGSTDEPFRPNDHYSQYYISSQDLLYENYIFQVDFSQATIASNQLNKTLFMELQDTDRETLVGVLGIQRDSTQYSVYTNNDAVISATATAQPETVYLGHDINLTLTTNYQQEIVDTKVVFDTTNFNKKAGVKISIFDSAGNQLNSDSLMGVYFLLNGVRYYPRIDGTTRIKIADRVSNVLSRIVIDTSQNTTLATGEYTIKIETFGSPDGIYYGLEASDYTEVDVYIINGTYGLKVTTQDNEKIVNKDTGKNQNNTARINSSLKYSSSLANPIITVSLERRTYNTYYDQTYEQVDLQDYVSNTLEEFVTNEYIVSATPSAEFNYPLDFTSDLMTGTYKLVYKLYDNTTYIGEVYEYIIIR